MLFTVVQKKLSHLCTAASFRYLRQTVDRPAEQDLGRFHKLPLISVFAYQAHQKTFGGSHTALGSSGEDFS